MDFFLKPVGQLLFIMYIESFKAKIFMKLGTIMTFLKSAYTCTIEICALRVCTIYSCFTTHQLLDKYDA